MQVVWSSQRGSRQIEHPGSAHDEAALEALKAAAQQRIAAGQLGLAVCLVFLDADEGELAGGALDAVDVRGRVLQAGGEPLVSASPGMNPAAFARDGGCSRAW